MGNNVIPISEQFFSYQGEGPYQATPAVFLRTALCNFLCGDGKYKEGSTWTCDTIPVFTKIQKKCSPQELLQDWEARGWVRELRAGAHLVLTGGEPLLPKRQKELIPFLRLLNSEGSVFTEVETNATYIPLPDLDAHVHHYNTSPKLANSGMPREMRYIPEVLAWHRDSGKSIFKFVVSDPNDIAEIEELILSQQLPPQKIWLMPAASTRADLVRLSPLVQEICARKEWRFSSRLHILQYDQTTGV